ncbi:MAG: hypothetical protein JWO92_2547 [Chitinophagaceae bacterium]|nr:hypothetical protein [Chitinophagaceae bacterium]
MLAIEKVLQLLRLPGSYYLKDNNIIGMTKREDFIFPDLLNILLP